MCGVGSNQIFQIAREAMATRFEFALHGMDAGYLRSAGEEALDEICRLEKALSFYLPTSEISQINREAGTRPVRINPETYQLISLSIEIMEKSGGLFDIAAGPLIHLWHRARESNTLPSPETIEETLACASSRHIELDPSAYTVRFHHPDMSINLGSIGKGYALHQAFEILKDLEVPHGLIQGGTSSIIAWGQSPENTPWKTAVQSPQFTTAYSNFQLPESMDVSNREKYLSVEALDHESLSISSIWGRGFQVDNQYLGHVIDPRTGWPVASTQLTCIRHQHAGIADALSTAFIAGGIEMVDRLTEQFPEVSGYLFTAPDQPIHQIHQNPGDSA